MLVKTMHLCIRIKNLTVRMSMEVRSCFCLFEHRTC